MTPDQITALIERLRDCAEEETGFGLRNEAATQLAALQAENAGLRVALAGRGALLAEVAAIKRHDPNGPRGFKRSTLTLNVPHELLEQIDTAMKEPK